jgi:hypothetical protein
MGSLHELSSGFVLRLALLVGALLFALFDVRAIVLRQHGLVCCFAVVPDIGAQMLRFPIPWRRPFAHHRVQGSGEQFHIMRVGSADDGRHRGSARVDQQVAFAPVFSGPWDWLQRTAGPAAPCPWRHRWTASAKRFRHQCQHCVTRSHLSSAHSRGGTEAFSGRQAADAVRSRIDWKYALSLELAEAGFDHSAERSSVRT